MAKNATLIVHAGGIRRSREELSTLHTPAGTPTWRPVPHADLVAELIRALEARGVTVAGDEYATMGRGDAKLFGVMRLSVPHLDTADYRMALGLRAANDRSMSIQVAVGVNVFVCDNMAFRGDSIVLRKRHTARLDLPAVLPNALAGFMEKAEAFTGEIDRMRDYRLTDNRAKELLHDAFTGRSPVLPLRLLPVVSRLYFDDDEQRARFEERSLWSLNNAMTEAVKALKPAPQANCGLRIGRFCSRVLRSN